MELVWLYVKGLGVIISIIGYIILFNYISYRYFKCDFTEGSLGVITAVVVPFFLPLLWILFISMIIAVPLMIGKAI